MNIINYVYNIFLPSDHERSIKIKKNVIASAFIKAGNIILELILVSFVLLYLDTFRYGIFLVMLSFVLWFNLLDFGLGNGLRNKFAEAIALGKHKEAKIYVSSCYTIISIISIIFFFFFLFFYQFLPWYKILAVDQSFNKEISILSLIVFASFSLKLILNLLSAVILAKQDSAIVYGIEFLGKILILLLIYILSKISSNPLLYIGLAYVGGPLLSLFIASLYLYNSKFDDYSPSMKCVDIQYGKKLLSIGWSFFILQFSNVILLLTDHIIITQLYGPETVTPYHIAGKYYGVGLSAFLVFITPMWSAYTEAFHKKDFSWIKKIIGRQRKIWNVLIVIVIIMIAISKYFFKIWVGEEIIIDFLLSTSWGLFVVLQLYNVIYTYFLNGVGIIKLQMITAIISMIINIPLSIFLAKYVGLGSAGVILATSISILMFCITRKIQYEKIINKRAKGIWNE